MAGHDLNAMLADIEADLLWRELEVQRLKRVIADASDDAVRRSLRRALIALLYAHVEGGVKVALNSYVRLLNAQAMRSDQAVPQLVASAWSDVFRALADPSMKSAFFKSKLPDDAALHRYARHAEFVSRTRELGEQVISLDEASLIDTEGNVDQTIIAKLLFRLGFEPNMLGDQFDDLQYLRGLRNPIAHGEPKVATETHCVKYEKAVFGVLRTLRNLLARAVNQSAYRRAHAA